MAYQSTIPAATDKLSDSQLDLQNNFIALNTYLTVNHVAFNGADQGKHKMVTFTDQSASVPAPSGTELAMYYATDPAYPLLGQQLWIQTGAGSKLPLIASNQATTGYTILPSSIKLAWAEVTWVTAGSHTFNLNAANLGASFPGFSSAVYNVQLTSTSAANDIYVVSIGAGPTYTVTYNVTDTTGSAYLFAIGL